MDERNLPPCQYNEGIHGTNHFEWVNRNMQHTWRRYRDEAKYVAIRKCIIQLQAEVRRHICSVSFANLLALETQGSLHAPSHRIPCGTILYFSGLRFVGIFSLIMGILNIINMVSFSKSSSSTFSSLRVRGTAICTLSNVILMHELIFKIINFEHATVDVHHFCYPSAFALIS